MIAAHPAAVARAALPLNLDLLRSLHPGGLR